MSPAKRCPRPRIPLLARGTLLAAHGAALSARLPLAACGDLCEVQRAGGRRLPALVAGFDRDTVTMAPLGVTDGLTPGAEVRSWGAPYSPRLPRDPRGCVLDALGEVVFGAPRDPAPARAAVFAAPPMALSRRPIDRRLVSGVRGIDAFCPLGYGQRIGLFAGSGSGKSTLLGMLARLARVDVCVAALIGERGREVGDFCREVLGPAGLRRAVVVASTSDEPPALRALALQTATAVAERYRADGKHVLLLADSLTRAARAVRDTALSCGEFPVRQGYPPAVFSFLPQVIERAGCSDRGSITAVYTVLTHEEDGEDALADEIRSLLDGHLYLDADLARRGTRPALDIARSLSRLEPSVSGAEARSDAALLRRAAARLARDRDVLLMGGSADPELQAALAAESGISRLLGQSATESVPLQDTLSQLHGAAREFDAACRKGDKTH